MKKIIYSLPGNSKITSVLFCFALSMILFPSGASAQPKFSGSWKLNYSLSTLVSEMTFSSQTLQIVQKTDSIAIDKVIALVGHATKERHSLNGAVCTNVGWREGNSSSTAMWNDQKKSLFIYTNMPASGYVLEFTEDYHIDTAGHLVIISSVNIAGNLMTETYVYDKQ